MRGMFVTIGAAAAGVLVAVYAMSVGVSAAAQAEVPEMGTSAIPAVLGALAAGILILRARRGAK